VKRLLVVLSALSLMLLSVPAGSAEPHGYTCNVAGAATFTPGVTSEMGKFKVNFKGELKDCQSTGDVTSAAVTATGTANASCAFGTVEGKGLIDWDTGKKTAFEWSTTDIGAAVILRGTVTKSNTDEASKGDELFSLLFFSADPTQCQSKKGLRKVGFQGVAGGGYPN
jgi:hypothetical protein